MRLAGVTGIEILAAAHAWPADLLGPAADCSDEQIYQSLLGDDWQTILQVRGWDFERVEQDWGVTRRGWTRASGFGSLELALYAAQKALESANISPQQLDCVFVASSTPHQITSTLAGKLVQLLGCNAAALDIRAGGAAALDSLATAALYHNRGCQTSLVVATEAASHYLGHHDLSNALLFGDGAAALVLTVRQTQSSRGMIGAVMGSSDWGGQAFTVPGRLPPPTDFCIDDYYFQRPDKIYQHSLRQAWDLAARTLKEAFKDECAALDAFLPYAVTKRQVKQAAATFAVNCDVSLRLLARRGCIGCVSPLAAIASYWLEKQVSTQKQQDRLIASLAVAGGISWAGLLWRL